MAPVGPAPGAVASRVDQYPKIKVIVCCLQ